MPIHIPIQSVSDELAESIKKVAEAAQAMEQSGVKQKTLVILLQESIGSKYITRDQIRYVLEELPRLANTYLNNVGK